MKKINEKEDIGELIRSNEIVAIYFTGKACGACEIIKEKIEKILQAFSEIQSVEINGEINLQIASKYSVFSLPIFLLFVQGKETIRVGRYVNLLELEQNIKRYYELIFS